MLQKVALGRCPKTSSLEESLGRGADAFDVAASGLGVGAAVLSETGVGGAVLGGLALGAKVSSLGLSAAKFSVQLYNGNRAGAAATLVGVGVGFLIPKGFLGVGRLEQKLGSGTAPDRVFRALSDVAGSPAGQGGEAAANSLLSGC